MKKYFLILILFICTITLIGCSSKSLDKMRLSLSNDDYVIDVEYTVTVEKKRRFLVFYSTKTEEVDREITLEKKGGMSEQVKKYMFWIDAIKDENFKKGLFKYNGDLDKINKQISFKKSGLYGTMFSSLNFGYGGKLYNSSSEIIKFSVKTSNDNITEVNMKIKVHEVTPLEIVYVEMNYEFSDFS